MLLTLIILLSSSTYSLRKEVIVFVNEDPEFYALALDSVSNCVGPSDSPSVSPSVSFPCTIAYEGCLYRVVVY